MTSSIRLAGCRLEPLASYLKSLGVLRTVHRQLDSEVRGCFRAGEFHLHTRVSQEELVRFFTSQYKPSPVVSPWSGSRGFYQKDNQTISAIEESDDPRLDAYRRTISEARAILRAKGIAKVPKEGNLKISLLRACRAALPDDAVAWLDVAYTLTDNWRSYSPLLVSGGNDGNLEFSLNFMEHITKLLLEEDGKRRSKSWLVSALFAAEDAPLLKSAVGMFAPGGAGGANAAAGFEGESLVNPWDFVLMIEGSLCFAGAVARRLGDSQTSKAVFPFTVALTPVGSAALSDNDSSGGQAAEIWFPVWSRPASFPEIYHVLSEGRAQSGREQARRGVDFAMAVAQLGVDRGIDSFQRYAFYVRNGKAHLATPLENIEVGERPDVNLITEVKPWIDSFRSAVTDKSPARFRSDIRRIDHAILEFCKLGGARRLQRILISLGMAERSLATGGPDELRKRVWPLRDLSPDWLSATNDGSPECRLAAALGSVGAGQGHPWPVRCQMEPVSITGNTATWSSDRNDCRESLASDLSRALLAVLMRRVILASKYDLALAPTGGKVAADLADIDLFICGHTDDSKLSSLLWSMMAINWSKLSPTRHWPTSPRRAPAELSRLYPLLKMVYSPSAIDWPSLSEPVSIRFEPAILTRLRSGDPVGAALTAIRRLRSSGLTPLIIEREFKDSSAPFPCPSGQAIRIGAALLFPLKTSDWHELCNMVLSSPSTVKQRL